MQSVDLIVPTYNNKYWLKRLLQSLADAKMPELNIVHIVDNHGNFYESDYFCPGLTLRVYKPGKNLGWTGGLAHALPHVESEFVVFQNDDTEFERLPNRLDLLLSHFRDPSVGAVGPATSIALGRQAVEGPDIEEVKVLIGFCMMLRLKTLEEIGGLDLAFPAGGDDFDLCIRLKKAGYKLILDRRVFVYHFAFKTGERLYGKMQVPGGWNSREMAVDVYNRISAKHGRDALLELIRDPQYTPETTKVNGH